MQLAALTSADSALAAALRSRWAWIAAGCVALACLDPFLAAFVPRQWWPHFFQAFPYKLAAIAVAAAAGLALARRAFALLPHGSFWIVAIFACAQLSGFRLGVIAPLDVVSILALLAMAAAWLAEPRREVRFPALFYFAGALLILALAQLVHQSPVRWLIGMLSFAKLLITAFTLVNLIDSPRAARIAVNAFMAVAAASALAGVVQTCLYVFAGIEFSLIEQFGADDSEVKATVVGPIQRASAFNVTAQHLAVFLCLCIPFYMFRATAPGPWRVRLAYLAGAGLLAAGVILSWNNVSIFALAGMLLLFPLLRWPRAALHIAAAAAIVIGILYLTGVLEWLARHYLGDAAPVSKGLIQRMALNGMAMDKLMHDPWIGEGLREFAQYSGNYWRRPVHNAYLQAATELGLPGAIVFVTLLAGFATALAAAAFAGREADDEAALLRLRPCLLGMIGLMLVMLGEPNFDNTNTWLFLALTQGILATHAYPRAPSLAGTAR